MITTPNAEREIFEALKSVAKPTTPKPAPRVLIVAADAQGKPRRILRQITRGGRIVE
ncbi:MAG TPA: hypothetical protein VK506_13780 [Conexibacter sp.]|nr:hypothetical protein [Conexibacter sp.]